jgi:3-methylfumaryl-CoA hydratase
MSTSYRVGDQLPPLEHTATPLQLFRYSAVTWNPHRIHFDQRYAREEGHDGIALHSHLRAALALRCVTEALGSDWHVEKVSYRLRKPVYAPADLTYTAQVTSADDNSMTLELIEAHASGEVGFEGTVQVGLARANGSGDSLQSESRCAPGSTVRG